MLTNFGLLGRFALWASAGALDPSHNSPRNEMITEKLSSRRLDRNDYGFITYIISPTYICWLIAQRPHETAPELLESCHDALCHHCWWRYVFSGLECQVCANGWLFVGIAGLAAGIALREFANVTVSSSFTMAISKLICPFPTRFWTKRPSYAKLAPQSASRRTWHGSCADGASTLSSMRARARSLAFGGGMRRERCSRKTRMI
jgi:hypothetical protein